MTSYFEWAQVRGKSDAVVQDDPHAPLPPAAVPPLSDPVATDIRRALDARMAANGLGIDVDEACETCRQPWATCPCTIPPRLVRMSEYIARRDAAKLVGCNRCTVTNDGDTVCTGNC
jgi:hypothetical protein